MMKTTLRRPCNDCPFRRKSVPGWLGTADPDWFVSAALADEYVDSNDACGDVFAAPCHQTIDYSDPRWNVTQLPDAEVCVGSTIFYRNVDPYKLPRQEQRSEMVAAVKPDHDTVFSTPDEFLDHHNGSVVKSWEFAREGS